MKIERLGLVAVAIGVAACMVGCSADVAEEESVSGSEDALSLPSDELDRAYDTRAGTHTENVRCESSGRYRRCPIDGRIVRARLVRQHSSSSCRNEWGFDRDFIWVDNGCRATFEVTVRDYGGHPPQDNYVQCESWGNRRAECDVGFDIDYATVARQLSSSECRRNRTYGWRGSKLWVDLGCRAVFRVEGNAWGGGGHGDDGWDNDSNGNHDGNWPGGPWIIPIPRP